jgi:Flp pilus assembly protein TadG
VVRRRSSAAAPRPDERGQATVELVAGIPALVICGLVAFQLLAVGYASSLAGDAAEAGAMAIAAGRPPAPAVRAALPGWARSRIDVSTGGGALTVNLRPPSPFAAIADRLEVSSSAWARPPAGDG